MRQGSIDGPLLSETFLSKYADDNNLYSIGKELNIIKEKLLKDSKVEADWFFETNMSLNPMCHHYMCFAKNKVNDTFNFENIFLKNSKEEAILGLTIDNKVSFYIVIKNGKIVWKHGPIVNIFA